MTMQIGQVVRSLAGHDRLQWYTVISVEEKAALLCDGKRRKTANPKKKKLMHLALTNTVLPPESLATDRQIRLALNRYCKTAQAKEQAHQDPYGDTATV